MLKIFRRSTITPAVTPTMTPALAPTPTTAHLHPTTTTLESDHPLGIRNLLDYPQLQAVMGGGSGAASTPVSQICFSSPFDGYERFEGAA